MHNDGKLFVNSPKFLSAAILLGVNGISVAMWHSLVLRLGEHTISVHASMSVVEITVRLLNPTRAFTRLLQCPHTHSSLRASSRGNTSIMVKEVFR